MTPPNDYGGCWTETWAPIDEPPVAEMPSRLALGVMYVVGIGLWGAFFVVIGWL